MLTSFGSATRVFICQPIYDLCPGVSRTTNQHVAPQALVARADREPT
jgi:hypothetical protein